MKNWFYIWVALASKEKILRCFYELSAMITFLKKHNQDYSILEDLMWLRDFLTDATEKLNELYLQLQGKNKNILHTIW